MFIKGYTPTVSGGCSDNRPSVAKFEYFTSYGNEKGAEWVFSSNLQFRNFLIFDQSGVGIETKTIVINDLRRSLIPAYVPTFYNQDTGPSIQDTVIVGNSDSASTESITKTGLVVAWDRGQLIKNTTFINFPSSSSQAIRGPEVLGKCT